MTLNASKSTVLTVSNKLTNIQHQYKLSNSTTLSQTSCTKDLGVWIDSGLKFGEHVGKAVNKAFRSLGFVIHSSRSFSKISSVLHLYRTLVAPHLEYNAVVWPPYYLKYMDALGLVQRRFTRFVFRKFHLPKSDYETRSKFLNLLTLRKQRIIAACRAAITVRSDTVTRSTAPFIERTWRLRSTYAAPIPRMIRDYNRHFATVDIFSQSRTVFRRKITEYYHPTRLIITTLNGLETRLLTLLSVFFIIFYHFYHLSLSSLFFYQV